MSLVVYDHLKPDPAEKGAVFAAQIPQTTFWLEWAPVLTYGQSWDEPFPNGQAGWQKEISQDFGGNTQARFAKGVYRIHHTWYEPNSGYGDDEGWVIVEFSLDSGTNFTRYARYRYYSVGAQYPETSVEWQQEY